MKDKPKNVTTLGKYICDTLGIKNCQKLTIVMAYNDIPRVYAKCLIKDAKKANKITTVMERYKLVNLKPEDKRVVL